MQLPPLDMTRPDPAQSDSLRDVPDTAWLVIVTLVVTTAAFLALTMIHGEHEYHGDRAATPEFMACLNAEFDAAIAERRPSETDHCKPVMPWYAAHPGWYALAIGGAVLIVGRGYLFMRRLEAGNGRR